MTPIVVIGAAVRLLCACHSIDRITQRDGLSPIGSGSGDFLFALDARCEKVAPDKALVSFCTKNVTLFLGYCPCGIRSVT